MSNILIIGGSNIDYLARSNNPLILKDSNIGTLTISYGGVGRNITENLARLTNQVVFLTCLSTDQSGQDLKNQLEQLRVKVFSLKTTTKSSSYVSMQDSTGDMKVAICDTENLDSLTIEDLLPYEQEINQHQNIVLDANLPQTIIDYIFDKHPNHNYFVEGVSSTKVKKLTNHLHQIYLFKSNLLEAQSILNTTNTDPYSLCQQLLDKGCKNVVITQGSEPIIFGTNNTIKEHQTIRCRNIVSTNGAGDALFAGVINALLENKDLYHSVSFGLEMACHTLYVEQAVNPRIFILTREKKLL